MEHKTYFGGTNDYDECIRLLEQVREIDKDNHFFVHILDYCNKGVLHLTEKHNQDSYVVEDLGSLTRFRATVYPVGEVTISREQFEDAIRCLVYDKYQEAIF